MMYYKSFATSAIISINHQSSGKQAMRNALMKKTTIKDVARVAGVSVATVDRVINNRATVSPVTKQLVLETVRKLVSAQGSEAEPEAMPLASERTLRFDFVLESSKPFIDSIKTAVEQNASLFRNFNISLNIREAPIPFSLEDFTQHLESLAQETDGLVLVCREDPAITACLNNMSKAKIPLICLTTDLVDTDRLGYVGINHVSAGRTAGRLLGQSSGSQSGELILLLTGSFRCQYERELGFRSYIREAYPNIRIREVYASQETDDDCFVNLTEAFKTGVNKPLGIYNTGGGNRGVGDAVASMGWGSEVLFVGHELNDTSLDLLAKNRMVAVLGQDTKSEVAIAVYALLHHHKRSDVTPSFTPAAPLVFLKENIGPLMSDGLPGIHARDKD